MEIRKNYDIKQMINELKENKNIAIKNDSCLVHVHMLLIQNAIDVLVEMYRREQKHQTLESALTFIKKEDGTQTNLMEEHNKKPECFGRYKKNDNWEICEECPYEMQCHMEEGKKIAKVITTEQKTEHCGCFGKYDEGDLDCLMCLCGDKCLKETEGDKRSRG